MLVINETNINYHGTSTINEEEIASFFASKTSNNSCNMNINIFDVTNNTVISTVKTDLDSFIDLVLED